MSRPPLRVVKAPQYTAPEDVFPDAQTYYHEEEEVQSQMAGYRHYGIEAPQEDEDEVD